MTMEQKNSKILHDYISIINDKLLTLVEEVPCMQESVINAMRYSLSIGGKRIRPILALEFCRMLGGGDSALIPACAIEMIHTFSLIHDDLPCMDDDDFRRGEKSCHVVFGEDIALLAGDALSIKAFEIIAQYAKDGGISTDTANEVILTLAKSSGVFGMCGGQVIDLESEGKSIPINTLSRIHELKTGELISMSCKIGCLVAGADKEQCEKAGLFGQKLGLAFQIIDDILDVEGDENTLGKPIGSDAEMGKTTYITLFGAQKAKEMAKAATDEALDILAEFPNSDFLISLTKELLVRNN